MVGFWDVWPLPVLQNPRKRNGTRASQVVLLHRSRRKKAQYSRRRKSVRHRRVTGSRGVCLLVVFYFKKPIVTNFCIMTQYVWVFWFTLHRRQRDTCTEDQA